jgi:multidrug efflux pump subunit AcrB
MLQMMLLGFIFIYLIMVAQFQSLLSPFIVIFTVPLAFTGGLVGLLISGQQLSLLSLMGFLILMGVIVNNGIVYVDFVNQLRLDGTERQDALVEAGRKRMRPILMTALTTILAMCTMIFSSDMGSDMGRGMAIVVVGGLIYATLMTLIIIPVLYDLMYKKPVTEVIIDD